MPGLFGYINYKTDENQLNKLIAGLKHFPFYTVDSWKDDEHVNFIRVGIERSDRNFYFDPGHDLVIGFHGVIDNYYENGKHNLNLLTRDYLSKSESLFRELSGNFLLLIYHIAQKKLILVPDMVAFQQCYYYRDGESFLFGQEMKAVSRLLKNKNVNYSSIMDFFNYGFPVGNETFIDGIHVLERGQYLVYENNDLKIKTYWTPEYKYIPHSDEMKKYVDEFHDKYDKINSNRAKGAENIIVALSGGLDSRLVYGHLWKKQYPLMGISYGIKYSRELAVAKKIVKKIQYTNHKIIEFNNLKNAVDEIEKTVYFTDGMTNLRCFFVNLFNRELLDIDRTGTLFFNGISGGGGSIGNMHYDWDDLKENLSKEYIFKKLSLISGGRYYRDPFYRNLFNKEFREQMDNQYEAHLWREYEKVRNVSPLFGHQLERFSRNTHYFRMSTHIDLNKFYWNEVFPFTAKEINEFYLRIPENIKFRRKLHVEILKTYYPELARIENFNTGKNLFENGSNKRLENLLKKSIYYINRLSSGKVYLPDITQYAPFDYWYNKYNEIRNFFEELLLDPVTINRGLFNKKQIEKLLKMEKKGITLFNNIAMLGTVELFFRNLEKNRF